jgi:hypothetical protein
MSTAKKLFFALPFAVSIVGLWQTLGPILESPASLFSTDPADLQRLGFILLFLILSGVFWAVFITLATDWQYVLPVLLIICLITFTLVPSSLALIFSIGLGLSLLISYFLLHRKLKTYITFHPPSLISPVVKYFSTLLVIVISYGLYLSSAVQIKSSGFTLPDSLTDTVVQIVANQMPQTQTSVPAISQEQLQQLRQNPELLKQYGLDPSILDEIDKPQLTQLDLLKPMVKTQIQTVIKPYLEFIPLLLGLLFFLTMESFIALIGPLVSLIAWITFWILEQIGFTKYISETREVKKLIV